MHVTYTLPALSEILLFLLQNLVLIMELVLKYKILCIIQALSETPGEKPGGSRAARVVGSALDPSIGLQLSLRGSYGSLKMGLRNSSYIVYEIQKHTINDSFTIS
jgi:hypothetical protein